MERKDNSAWIVIRTPNGETRVIEAEGYAIVTETKDPGEAIRIGRKRLVSATEQGE